MINHDSFNLISFVVSDHHRCTAASFVETCSTISIEMTGNTQERFKKKERRTQSKGEKTKEVYAFSKNEKGSRNEEKVLGRRKKLLKGELNVVLV